MTYGELLHIAAKHWVHKACCLYRAEQVSRRQTALAKTHEECVSAIMPWNSGGWWEGLDGGCSHRWTDVSPVLTSRGDGRLHFCFSPLQLSFLIELRPGFLLAFPFTCVDSITVHELPGSCCSPSAAAFWVFCRFTKVPSNARKGCASPTLSHLSALHWSFPRGKPAKTL